MKSDYCELICWISCTHLDVKFMYVKLTLNMLLLLNLHVRIVVIWYFVDFCSNWYKLALWLLIVMNSWLNDVVVVMRCCCWFMPWVFHSVKLLFGIMKFVLCFSYEGPELLIYEFVDWVFDVVEWIRLSRIYVFMLWLR